MDLYAIWSERNTAVRECNMAVVEKRQAMADRDMAILQRDAAFADRDNVRKQRDNAIAQLQVKSNLMNGSGVQLQMKDNLMNVGSAQMQLNNNSMNGRYDMIHDYAESGVNCSLSESGVIHNLCDNGMIHNPSDNGVSVSQGVKELSMVPKQQQRRQHIVNYSEIAFKPVEVPFSDVFGKSTTTASKSTNAKKGKSIKETKTGSSTKAVKPVRETKIISPKRVSKPVKETKTIPTAKALKPTGKISKRTTRISNKSVTVAVSNHASSDNGTHGRSGNLEKQIVLKGGLSLNELGLDYVNLPVPFCSCTGNPQSCYKWGKGGWQSACCTTIVSMYPLPQMPNKRHSRMGGRKMSGGAFTKLIIRLASEGQNITVPIDLKNHWARHGTNRYIIIR